MKISLFLAAATLLSSLSAGPALGRDEVHIVGSSTVFPYARRVVDAFASTGKHPTPTLASTGTGSGIEAFCAGVGEETPDIANASRAMTLEEYQACRQNGVGDITKVRIGYDGLSVAYSKDASVTWALSLRDLYAALAKTVPSEGGFAPNPAKVWSDVNPALPDTPIKVFGPPPSSGTRDSFAELAMEKGCNAFPAIAALEVSDPDRWTTVCTELRTDGAYIEGSEDDEEIVKALVEDPEALGIFGYAYLFHNDAVLRGASVAGVVPSFVTIATGDYPMSRPLFFYIKNAHREVVPSLNPFIAEYVSADAISPYGYMAEEGMTPILDDEEREQTAGEAIDGVPMKVPAH
ncbi:MAG: substrate-binding domain-containing protein [Devosia sp.]